MNSSHAGWNWVNSKMFPRNRKLFLSEKNYLLHEEHLWKVWHLAQESKGWELKQEQVKWAQQHGLGSWKDEGGREGKRRHHSVHRALVCLAFQAGLSIPCSFLRTKDKHTVKSTRKKTADVPNMHLYLFSLFLYYNTAALWNIKYKYLAQWYLHCLGELHCVLEGQNLSHNGPNSSFLLMCTMVGRGGDDAVVTSSIWIPATHQRAAECVSSSSVDLSWPTLGCDDI